MNLYFARHWYGELSLARSYWINLILVSAVIAVLIAVVGEVGAENIRFVSFILLVVMVSQYPIYIWQVVGTWRAATKHIEKTKKLFWARAAQVMMVLGGLQAVGNYSTVSSQFAEFRDIAFDTGAYGKNEVSLLQNGKELQISGGISFGLTEEVEEVFKSNPNIEIVRLDSYGGRVGEARLLRDFILNNDITTYSANGCISACTIAFLGGRERVLNEKAKLGFHQYSFPGFSAADFQAEHEADKLYMASVGVHRAFLQKAYTTASHDMWYPTLQELVAANVVTRISSGHEFGQLPITDEGLVKLTRCCSGVRLIRSADAESLISTAPLSPRHYPASRMALLPLHHELT